MNSLLTKTKHIPPTADALLQHTARVAYQADHCWGQCIVSNPKLPSPSEWGWARSKSDAWTEASKVCQELVKCGCKAEIGCKGHCKPLKAGISLALRFVNAVGNASERIKLLDLKRSKITEVRTTILSPADEVLHPSFVKKI